MIKDVMVIECEDCNGAGFVFFGSGEDFDVESCDCVNNANDELTLDWINN